MPKRIQKYLKEIITKVDVSKQPKTLDTDYPITAQFFSPDKQADDLDGFKISENE